MEVIMDQAQAKELNAVIVEIISDNLSKDAHKEQDPEALKTAINTAVVEVLTSQITDKKVWMSKTFWANIIFAGAILAQSKYGFIIGPDVQALALVGINLALRKITKTAVVW
jgi:hypothetical protein